VTGAALRRARAAGQWLGRPATEPAAIVRHLLAVQAQDLRAARLALRARGTGFDAAEVDAALADGTLVIAWLLRGTLHLVAREDHGWLLGLTAPIGEAASRRRLGQLGVRDPGRAVGLIASAVAERPHTRAELGARLAGAGIAVEGQALPHLLMRAARAGACVVGAGGAFVPAPAGGAVPGDPLGELGELGELARRYLAAHRPAEPQDLAAWSGLPLRDARAGFAAAGKPGGGRPPARVAPRLLPAFDPYLLGWRSRDFAVPAAHARAVHPGGGMLRATMTADGRAVGTWTLRGGKVALEPFAPLPARARAALERDAADVERFAAG
jgi:Winged helix DNA-binding domain